MFVSLAIIILLGFAFRGIMTRLKLPGLLGFLLAGLLLGPFALDLISPDLLDGSAVLRKIALVVILIRAGLAIDIRDLKRVGRPAILLGFVPAVLEIAIALVTGPLVFGFSLMDSALLGCALAAVSPAVVIPGILRLMESADAKRKQLLQMVMAGATVDNVVVVTIFSVLLTISAGGEIGLGSVLDIPIAVLTGVLAGAGIGLLACLTFRKIQMRDTVKAVIILGIAFFVVGLEELLAGILPFSSLLAVVALASIINARMDVLARRLSGKFAKVWIGAEMVLFVLVGAMVDVYQVASSGPGALIVIAAALLMRWLGVAVSTLKTPLSASDRLFSGLANTPKASLQAVLGALPLTAGLASGPIILSVCVLSIVLLAPAGAIAMDVYGQKLLRRDRELIGQKGRPT